MQGLRHVEYQLSTIHLSGAKRICSTEQQLMKSTTDKRNPWACSLEICPDEHASLGNHTRK